MKTKLVFMLTIFFSILFMMNLAAFSAEPNRLPDTNSLDEAVLLKPGLYTGSLGEIRADKKRDTEDYYSIEVEEGQIITLKLVIPGNANFGLTLFNPNRNSKGSTVTDKEYKILDYVADSTGTWYIRISRSSGEGEYQLSVEISVLDKDDDTELEEIHDEESIAREEAETETAEAIQRRYRETKEISEDGENEPPHRFV